MRLTFEALAYSRLVGSFFNPKLFTMLHVDMVLRSFSHIIAHDGMLDKSAIKIKSS